ncbi:MAG: DUF4124 domain-containing protein [Deltaproteobacteria bacterium]|nr:DUF4124 domain-containing protein [Deltaproteobacteria bacterium]
MGKSAIFVLFSAVMVLASSVVSAQADYYGYKDAKGVWRYTDDMGSIPAAYRKSMKVLKSEKPEEKPAEAADSGKAADDKGTDAAAKSGSSDGGKGMGARLEMLNRERDALEKERESLAAERSALEQERTKTASRKSQAEINEKAKAYNERVKAYDARRQAYEKKVKETVTAR